MWMTDWRKNNSRSNQQVVLTWNVQWKSQSRYCLVFIFHNFNHDLSLYRRVRLTFSFENHFFWNNYTHFSLPYLTTWLQVVPLLATRVSSPSYLTACISTSSLIPPHAYQYHSTITTRTTSAHMPQLFTKSTTPIFPQQIAHGSTTMCTRISTITKWMGILNKERYLNN